MTEAPVAARLIDEPVRGSHMPAELLGLPGVEQLRLLATRPGLKPPIGHLLGMSITEVGQGTVTFMMPITDWLLTPQGIVTGGAVAMLADGPLGSVVHTMLPPGSGYTTTELSISMVRPVPRSGHLIARGRLVHGGRRLALSETDVTDDTGRLLAHGTSRCFVFPPHEAPPPENLVLPADDDLDGWTPPYRRPAPGTVLAPDVWSGRSGLDVMRALISGELPLSPIHYLLGIAPVDADEGRAEFRMPASDWLTSPLGLIEGGIIACLADLALAGAVQTTVPAGDAFAPTDLRVQFLRPAPPDGRQLTASASVLHRGRTVAVTRGEVVNSEGKLVAAASSTSVILPGLRADLSDLPHLG